MIGIVHRAKQAAKVLLNLRRRPRPTTFEEQVFSRVVREGDACFDIGANVGWIALFLARTTGCAGTVVAFEPVWPTYVKMCRHIQACVNVKGTILTMPFGLAETEKSARIHVPNGRYEYASLSRADELTNVFDDLKFTTHECRFFSLDKFLESTDGIAADFWKIDTEGAELFVLQGAARHFAAGARPLILAEVYAPWQRRCGYGPWEFFAPLLGLGYRFLFLCPGGLVDHAPRESTPFPPEFEDGSNVLAYVPGRHDDRIQDLADLRLGTGRALRTTHGPFPNRIDSP